MRKIVQLIFFVLILFFFLFCNQNKTNFKLNSGISSDDSLKIINLIQVIKTSENQNEQNLKILTQKTDDFLESVLPDTLLPEYYNKIGLIFYEKSNYNYAQNYFNKAYLVYKNNNNEIKAAKELTNISVIKELSGKYEEAIDNYLKALKLFKAKNDSVSIAFVSNNIGVLYQNINNNKKAIEYYKLALKNSIQKESIAQVTANLGVMYEDEKNLDSAFYYYQNSLNIYKTLKKDINTATVINNIGYIYFKKNIPDSAKLFFEKALSVFEKNSNISGEVQSYRNLGEYYSSVDNFKKSEKYLLIALNKAKEIKFSKLIAEITELLSTIYEKQNKFQKENKYLKYHYKIKDSLFKEENIKQINILEIKYQLRDKNSDIKILRLNTQNQHKQILLQLLLIVLLSISTAFVIYIYLHFKHIKTLEIEKMQNEIYEYLCQIDNYNKSFLNLKTLTKESILDSLNDFDLTQREKEVLLLIAEGNNNKEIAEKMFISLNTVKTHTKNIFLKLDVKNRIEALRRTRIL